MSEFPVAPVVGVGAVIVRDGRALIVKRGHAPRKGEWSLPGGRVELGESLVDATRREMREETALAVDVGPIVEVFDRIHEKNGRIQYHFVVVDFLCACGPEEARAGDDAVDVAWVTGEELEAYGVNAHAAAVIRKGLAMSYK
jgi:8-oxo-dGTP diphosphatase